MAVIYVRSTDGNNADNGSTWPLAKATISGADAAEGAGDTIWVSQAHTETGGTTTWSFSGTPSNPDRLVCGNDSAQPPTAVATGATVTSASNTNVLVNGSVYVYGMTLIAGGTTQGASVLVGQVNHVQVYESCSLQVSNTNVASVIWAISGDRSYVQWRNVTVKFGASAQKIAINGNGFFHWQGGALLSGGTSPSLLITFLGTGGRLLVEDVDLSNASSTIQIFSFNTMAQAAVIRNCKLPASWAGNLASSWTLPGRAEMWNCNAGAVNYAMWIDDFFGSIKQETTNVRTGGASDGATTISWKCVTTSNPTYPSGILYTPEIVAFNGQTGVAKTVTVEILRDSATNLTDKDIWLEVNYLGSSGAPVGTLITDAAADFAATAADQAASSATWTTTGLTNPNKQKLSVTFTPQMKGRFIARVAIAKPSTTIFVDPKLVIT